MTSVVIVGGGPGGYEAALVARQLGADVTVIDRDGIGGSAVLTDCVPSKALIATANIITEAANSATLGVLIHGRTPDPTLVGVDLAAVNARITQLAQAQSDDIRGRLEREGIRLVHGSGRLAGEGQVAATHADGRQEQMAADIVLLSTGARPRVMPEALPDGERILTWEQVYDLPDVPERLIVVGSGVTGAEFAGAYHALGSRVVLISSREHVLPSEDPDAAAVLEDVYRRRGLEVLQPLARRGRPAHGRRRGGHPEHRRDRQRVACPDGRRVAAQHRRPRPGERGGRDR